MRCSTLLSRVVIPGGPGGPGGPCVPCGPRLPSIPCLPGGPVKPWGPVVHKDGLNFYINCYRYICARYFHTQQSLVSSYSDWSFHSLRTTWSRWTCMKVNRKWLVVFLRTNLSTLLSVQPLNFPLSPTSQLSSQSNLSTLLSVQPLNSPLSPNSRISSQSNLSYLLSVQPLNSPLSPTSQLSSQSNLSTLLSVQHILLFCCTNLLVHGPL